MNLYDWAVLLEKYKPFLVAIAAWAWIVGLIDLVITGPTLLNLTGFAFGFVALFGWTMFRDW